MKEEQLIEVAPVRILSRNPYVYDIPDSQLKILSVESVYSVELEDSLLRIDLLHRASRDYIGGGWVQIQQGTFIRPSGTRMRLDMVSYRGIPLAPRKHYYKSCNDILQFSLFFPLPPAGTTEIDLIEKVGGDSSFFNVFGISLEKVRTDIIHLQ
jgi:hypothetical protein